MARIILVHFENVHIKTNMKIYILKQLRKCTYWNNYANVHTGTNMKMYIQVVIYMHFTDRNII